MHGTEHVKFLGVHRKLSKSPSLMSVMQANRRGVDFDKSGAKLGGTLHCRRHFEGLELTFQLIMFTVFWNVTQYILVVGASVSEELQFWV